MAYEKTKIRTVSKPTIVLQDMITDQKMESVVYTGEYKASSYIGRDMPYIKFKDRVIEKDELNSFEIDCTNFLPIVHIKLAIIDRKFLAEYLPKDGDIISIYMRSHNNAYKPARNDYLITHVDTNNLDGSSYITEYYITGILNIKNIWIEKNIAIKGKSIDVIKKVADELQLGFATNVEGQMDDEMVWICDWKSYKDFLLHVTEHAWKNEKTFYRVFIDIYYHVNFIEVEKQLDMTREFDESLTIIQKSPLVEHGDPLLPIDEQMKSMNPLTLTNFSQFKGTSSGITKYELVNNSSHISYSEGYGKKMYYYDHYLKTIEETNQIDFNPLYTEGTEASKIRLRGLKDEDIEKRHLKNTWYGIQYSLPMGNVHKNFAQAYFQNKVNTTELEKMYMDVDTFSWNPAIIKMERIPLFIFEENRKQTEINTFMDKDESKQQKENPPPIPSSVLTTTINRFLSGFYLVEGFKIIYDVEAEKNYCQFRLTRREWGVPKDTEVL
jgi:hypothetical protein